jgi:hypothetical protein
VNIRKFTAESGINHGLNEFNKLNIWIVILFITVDIYTHNSKVLGVWNMKIKESGMPGETLWEGFLIRKKPW